MHDWVTIKIFTNQFEAEFNKSVLAGNNIPAEILADGIPRSYIHLHMSEGIKLQVPREKIDEALQVLASSTQEI
jgi:hypothetical protein